MEKEFIPYEQALTLKELGFNEPCIANYTSHGYYNSVKELKWKRPTFSLCGGVTITNESLTWQEDPNVILKQVIAPLYQQAFNWFRDKYKLHGFIENTCVQDGNTYHAYINSTNVGIIGLKSKRLFNMFDFKTYEEAQIECLKKLIEIVKNK